MCYSHTPHTIHYALYTAPNRAPWVPKLSGSNDMSHFDPMGCEGEHMDTGYVDHGNWDKDF
ncbi:hypothetical protein EON63_20015 [archaeon]|nr:MAG: hypothetical protein EON63_20015 [archaeon]